MCNTRHIFIKFLYFGWDYQGLVVQEETDNTIEEHLFNALTKTCLIKDRQSCNFHRCGRTDKGVSGYSQVVSLDVRSKVNSDSVDDADEFPYCRILNSVLPNDIRILSWCPVPDKCSARYNCVSRTYKYYFIKGQLNIKAMEEAASKMVGEHDFRNLCKMDVGNGIINFVRKILSACIDNVSSDTKDDDDIYDIYVLKITSDGFLWHQIRCIMSILFMIGENRETPQIVEKLLNVVDYPRKPQYSMALNYPLIFYDCRFDFEPNWKYDKEDLRDVLLKLQKKWALIQVKCSQVKDTIDDIERTTDIKLPEVQSSGLFLENYKTHKPLLERPTCESLESRIEHYVKRQRIEMKEDKE
ncbi:tRNA pseudouridine(38/39) synthase isoform X2 [Lycorma delicatula]|uniref:tRNA pseudouridine(38/39) synthase isoform X2 n=1 Tax=Lycorma delicatula TaxID=130591 RepID=UPI003F511B4E